MSGPSAADFAAALARITALEGQVTTLQNAPPVSFSDVNESLDTIWMLLTGYLVWMMSSGFCFLEMGSVRVKNSQNILAKNIIVPVVAFLCWYVMGYALGFGVPTQNPNKFIGATYFVLYGFMDPATSTLGVTFPGGHGSPGFRHWFFQGAFCDTSASIVSGGVAERMSMFGFIVHSIFMTAFIYPTVVYWAWSGAGWLNYIDPVDGVQKSTVGPWYQDWAGSGVIHLCGGVAALVGAIVVGPRKGRFDPDTPEDEYKPHSIPFTVLGTFILWFGWYGFNPGCVANMHTAQNAYTAAIAVANTTLAPVTAGVVTWLMRKYVLPPHCFDVPALCNGILAGLVAVTAPSGFVKHWEAIIIGGLSGVFYCLSAYTLPKLKIDDPIDAVSVHMVNGLWGAAAVGLFGNPKDGLMGNGNFWGGNQFKVQVLAIFCIMVWSGALSLLVFVPMQLAGVLRWSDEIQDHGADIAQHSPPKVYEAARQSLTNGQGSPNKEAVQTVGA